MGTHLLLQQSGVAQRGQHAEHVLVRQLLPLVAHLRDDELVPVRDLSGRDEPRAAVEDARPQLLLGEAHHNRRRGRGRRRLRIIFFSALTPPPNPI